MTTPASTPASTRAVPPRTPDDVPGPDELYLGELAHRHERHAAIALHPTPHLYPAEKGARILAALATRTALLDRIDRAGWPLTVAALRAGLTLDEIAAAMGVPLSTLLMYLASWLNERWPTEADRDEEYLEVVKLIADATPDSPT